MGVSLRSFFSLRAINLKTAQRRPLPASLPAYTIHDRRVVHSDQGIRCIQSEPKQQSDRQPQPPLSPLKTQISLQIKTRQNP